MEHILDRVTITGADDSIAPEGLRVLSDEYPKTEWGILVSEHKTILSGGAPRFPSMRWLKELHGEACRHKLRLSLHLCGRWVRELCAGNWGDLTRELGEIMDVFQRIQLNFHGHVHELNEQAFVDGLHLLSSQFNEPKQYIFQLDDVNDWIASYAFDEGVDAHVLYDESGGAGKLPEVWTVPMQGIYTGYAGGLGPENIVEQLQKIAGLGAVHNEIVWIDAETRIRTDDELFDLEKAAEFLRLSAPWVKE